MKTASCNGEKTRQSNHPFPRKLSLLGILLGYLTGCANMLNNQPHHDPAFAAVTPQMPTTLPTNPGAIFQPGVFQPTPVMRLYENRVARNVGDILTVKLVEKTQAQKDATTDAKRENSTEVKIPTIFGAAPQDLLGFDLNQSLESKNSFTGEGQSNQSNALTGFITVSVVEVLANGYLRIRGEKRLTLNQGDEFIRLSGIVRPTDIDALNIVESTRIADATIQYTGEGVLNDVNRMGWLARFINSIFFPF